MSDSTIQQTIVRACEEDLARFGDTVRGAGYTKPELYADRCYRVMLGVIREEGPASVLDLGCGTGRLLEYIRRSGRQGIDYAGLDLSARSLAFARDKFPGVPFIQADVLAPEVEVGPYDYVIMNGLFNYKGTAAFADMLHYWQSMAAAVFPRCRRGLAFNAMSKIVDWERDDLFHLPLDEMGRYVAAHLSRHFVVRHDYGAYEYTTYVYREPGGR